MNRLERNQLLKCREAIVDDLDVSIVLDTLIESDVLNNDDKKVIQSQNTSFDQVHKLLDLLPERGPDAFRLFVESLEEDYEWLAERLLDGLSLTDVDNCDDVSGQNSKKSDSAQVILKSLLLRGGVPYEPANKIDRPNELSSLKKGLAELEQGHFLVLHGMAGAGKSVLAAEVLRLPEVTVELFPDGVFWFRVGVLEKSELLTRIRILLEKLSCPTIPSTIEHGQELLRNLFVSARYQKSLLVLDDVWTADVVRTFNDVSVTDCVNSHAAVIELQTGFTQEESLRLLSSFVGQKPEDLPEEAALIHKECRGSPMVISLIGGLVSEVGKQQGSRQWDRWFYYLSSLRSRRYSKLCKQKSYQHANIMDAVALSVENLEPKLREKYRQLVVFVEDICISTKVLMTYWGMERVEVEDVMNNFVAKSLAQSEYDESLQCYVYNIHDLQLDYVKSSFASSRRDTHETEAHLHRLLLQKYFDKAGDVYGHIDDDSYIFGHLSYHLYKSEEHHLFPRIFLDLGFVQAMLKALSPVDLLNDYKQYEQQIMGLQEEHLDELEDYEAFVRTVGAAFKTASSMTDIIQLALSQDPSSAVYQAARREAIKHQTDRLFFEWQNRSSLRGQHSATILHHGKVQDAKFLPDITKVLTSNGDGQIKLWDVQSGLVLRRFTGHTGCVKNLSVSPSGDMFASGSEDGSVKIWDLGSFLGDDDFSSLGSQVGGEMVDPREALRRISHGKVLRTHTAFQAYSAPDSVASILTQDQNLRDVSNQSFRFEELAAEAVLCVDFSPEGDEIVASGTSGKVKVYNLRSRRVRLILDEHREAVNVCRFSPDGQVICTGSVDATIRLWRSNNGHFLGSNNLHTLEVKDVRFLPQSPNGISKLVSMSAQKLIVWDSPLQMAPSVCAGLHQDSQPQMSMMEFRRGRQAAFICMAVSEDGELLAAATEDNRITVWEVCSARVVVALPGHADTINSLAFTPDDPILLSGSSDETMMIWSLDDLERAEPDEEAALLSLGPAFDCKFFADNSFRAAAADDGNAIQILESDKSDVVIRSATDKSWVSCLNLSADGEAVAVGYQNGSVKLYRPAKGLMKTLGRHKTNVEDIKISMDGNTVSSVGEDGLMKMFRDGGRSFTCTSEKGRSNRRLCKSELVFYQKDTLVMLRKQDQATVETWEVLTGRLLRSSRTPEAEGAGQALCMDIHETSELVAVGFSTGHVALLNLKTLELTTKMRAELTDDVRICKCRFSPDGKCLALALENGKMEIWDVRSNTRQYKMFHLHSQFVKDMRFRPGDNTQLVSAGDRLAWWALSNLPRHRTSTANLKSMAETRARKRSGLFGRRPRRDSDRNRDGSSTGTATTETLTEVSSSEALASPSPTAIQQQDSVFSKAGFDPRRRELLQVFDVKGNGVSKVFCSKDFKKFVTIDDAGILYILEEI